MKMYCPTFPEIGPLGIWKNGRYLATLLSTQTFALGSSRVELGGQGLGGVPPAVRIPNRAFGEGTPLLVVVPSD
jgi:hypothetical protein